MPGTFASLQENLHNNPMRKTPLLFFRFKNKERKQMKVGKGNSVDPDLGTTSCCSIFLCSQVNGVNREKTQCQETLVPF